MQIEDAKSGDIDAIADLWVELAREQREHGSHLEAEANRERIRESIGRSVVADELLVARAGGEIVGFVMFGLEQRLYRVSTVRGIVHNLYVRPAHRDGGIGTALLESAERRLVDAGADAISLEALAANEAARRFYERHGYAPHRIALEKRVETANRSG